MIWIILIENFTVESTELLNTLSVFLNIETYLMRKHFIIFRFSIDFYTKICQIKMDNLIFLRVTSDVWIRDVIVGP